MCSIVSRITILKYVINYHRIISCSHWSPLIFFIKKTLCVCVSVFCKQFVLLAQCVCVNFITGQFKKYVHQKASFVNCSNFSFFFFFDNRLFHDQLIFVIFRSFEIYERQ